MTNIKVFKKDLILEKSTENNLKYINFNNLKNLPYGSYTYKDLYEKYNIFNKYSSGNTKIAQLNELGCCCEFIQKGKDIVIGNIYDKPIIIGMIEYDGEYISEIKKLIFDRLKNNNYTIKSGLILLALELGMINNNFIKIQSAYYSSNIEDLSFIAKQYGENISTNIISYTFKNVKDFVISTLMRAINSCKNAGHIETQEKIKIVKICDNNEVHDYATDDEIKIINECKNKALEIIGYSNINQLIYDHKSRATYNNLLKKLYEGNNILYSYKVLEIFTSSIAEQNAMKTLSIRDKQSFRNKLNNVVKNGIEKKIKNNNNKLRDKYNNRKYKVSELKGTLRYECHKKTFDRDTITISNNITSNKVKKIIINKSESNKKAEESVVDD